MLVGGEDGLAGGGPMGVTPAVDVLGGGAVRLHQGAYDTVVARAGDPVALARAFAEAGAGRVHLVDLDGARSGRGPPQLLSEGAAVVPPLQASGRVRSLDDAPVGLDARARRGGVGTAALPHPAPWARL